MAFSKQLSQKQDRRSQTSHEELREQDPAKMNWGWKEMHGRSQWIDLSSNLGNSGCYRNILPLVSSQVFRSATWCCPFRSFRCRTRTAARNPKTLRRWLFQQSSARDGCQWRQRRYWPQAAAVLVIVFVNFNHLTHIHTHIYIIYCK